MSQQVTFLQLFISEFSQNPNNNQFSQRLSKASSKHPIVDDTTSLSYSMGKSRATGLGESLLLPRFHSADSSQECYQRRQAVFSLTQPQTLTVTCILRTGKYEEYYSVLSSQSFKNRPGKPCPLLRWWHKHHGRSQ